MYRLANRIPFPGGDGMTTPLVRTKHREIHEADIEPLTSDELIDGILGFVVLTVAAGSILALAWMALGSNL